MKQSQRITQSLGLSQRQMQAMTLLAMTSTEIDAYLEEVALENPVIEVVRPDVEVAVAYAGEQTGSAGPNWDEVGLAEGEELALEEFLLSQVDDARLAPEELRVLRYLIGMIDENGYLSQSEEQVALCAGAERTTVSSMVDLLHTLEPHGIGARTVRESLLLQIDALPTDAPLAAAIVSDHLSALAKNRISELERAFPASSRQEILEAIGVIRGLDPRPGLPFAVERTQYVLADVIVVESHEGLEVVLGPAGGHDVRLDGGYRAAVGRPDDPGTRAWMEEKYRQAYWLRSCLKQRRDLMLSVAEQLVARQKAFFSFGPRYLDEVTMSGIAEDLSISVSTVSRAVKGAYVQCRWGVLPMKALFSHSSIARPAAGGDPRSMLRDIVDAEQSAKPLSDQKIVEEFARRGIEISRRTVARYRQELNIPPAAERRYR